MTTFHVERDVVFQLSQAKAYTKAGEQLSGEALCKRLAIGKPLFLSQNGQCTVCPRMDPVYMRVIPEDTVVLVPMPPPSLKPNHPHDN